MRHRPAGFTLIELLIVVAIIAILAAIAVPNFLEAQTRAKVSRAKTDLRTLAVGLESYAVDHNKYPYAENLPGQPWLPPAGQPRVNSGERCGGLTSPIAYLTTLPIDVFEHPINTGFRVKAPVYYERAGFVFVNGAKQTNQTVTVPNDAIGVWAKFDGVSNGPGDEGPATLDQTPAHWVLYSIGPDLDFQIRDSSGATITNSRYNLNNRYDPTNGTVSAGNVLQYPGGTTFP